MISETNPSITRAERSAMVHEDRIQQAKNDLANEAVESIPSMLARIKATMTDTSIAPDKRGKLLANIRGNALQRAYPNRSALKRAVERVLA